MAYTELVVLWQGALNGMPGYSKFRFIGEISGSQLQSAATNLTTFLNAWKAWIPSALTLTIQPTATTHADDGTLSGEVVIPTPPAPIAMTGAGVVMAASGAMVRWQTGAINGGHKVEGRTYFVPAIANLGQSDGTIVDATRTTLAAAATAFATSTPSPAVNSRANPAKPARGNATYAIISATIPDKQVIMRSRRD
jgi:hypothetical protein